MKTVTEFIENELQKKFIHPFKSEEEALENFIYNADNLALSYIMSCFRNKQTDSINIEVADCLYLINNLKNQSIGVILNQVADFFCFMDNRNDFEGIRRCDAHLADMVENIYDVLRMRDNESITDILLYTTFFNDIRIATTIGSEEYLNMTYEANKVVSQTA